MNRVRRVASSIMQWESRVSVVDSSRAKKFLATLSALVVAAAMLAGARVAMADSVWVQSYERASQTATCDDPPEPLSKWRSSWANPYDPISGPTWHPSWEQWANDGNGGWVCTRSITWARTPGAPTVSGGGGGGGESGGGGGGGSVTYRVGDVGPAGGTIFYIDLARPAGSQFWEVGSNLGTAQWGCRGTIISGATGDALGDGAANTAAIQEDCETPGIAARVASAPAGGFSDWFLPSAAELNQLCKYARGQSTDVADQAVQCDGSGSLRSGFAGNYWESTQPSGTGEVAKVNAAFRNFNDGVGYLKGKSDPLNVRPVRSF